MAQEPINSYDLLNPNNIVISDLKNRRQPRIVVMTKAYPVATEVTGYAPFGIDMSFGKRYMKFTLEQSNLAELFRAIDLRLMNLIPGLKSSMSGNNTILTILDKNVKICDNNGNATSSYAIEKGTKMTITIELGDIYTFNDTSNYKWIVKNIIIE